MSWAITGMGLVSSLGNDTATSLDAFAAGATSVQPLRAYDRSRYRVHHAYELDGEGSQTAGRPGFWLGRSVAEALAQADLSDAGDLRMPVLVGTGLAEQRTLELWCTGRAAPTMDDLHFGPVIRRMTGLPHTITIVNACSASLYALAVATDLLALDEADAVVVAGTDSLSESMFGLLDRVNARPPTEVRPFDVDRQGVILGEGAAAIVLEPLWRAADRGVTPLAILRGVGTSCDAHHVTAPLKDGIAAAFRSAHTRAGIAPDQIDVVFAHGTGTFLNDQTEAEALRDVFTGRKPMVTALKSLIGHTSGASGLMSLIAGVGAMHDGRIPPTRNHRTPIEPIQDFPIVTEATKSEVDTVQVDAFGFGGVNAVAVLSKQDGPAGTGLAPRDVVVSGVGWEVPDEFEPAKILGERGLRYKDRATLLGLCAAARAFEDAGHGREPSKDFGIIVATERALIESVNRVVSMIHERDVMQCSPMDLPNVSGNVAAAQIAIWFGLTGLNLTFSAGASSGVDALYHAAAAIRAGRAQRMLVVGVEPDEPAVRKFLGTDNVFDGAAAIVLEAADVARQSYAHIGQYARTLEPVQGESEANAATGVLAAAKAAVRMRDGELDEIVIQAGDAPYASLRMGAVQ